MKKTFFLILVLFCLSGCSLGKKVATQENNLGQNKKKVVVVIAPIDFRDIEYSETREVIEKNGADVKVASIQKIDAIGTDGMKVKAEMTVAELDPANFDAIIFIGGPGMAQIIGDDTLQLAAKKFYMAGKVTAAICMAPSILARAGILKDKKATGFNDVKKDIIDGEGEYLDMPVVVDNLIVTANGPDASREFGEKVIEQLK